jgi:hypothetical protein
MESRPESIEQSELCPIPHRVAIQVQRRGKLQADNRRDPRRQVNRQCAGLSTQGSLDPVGADTDRSRHFADTHSARDPCTVEVGAQALAEEPASFRAERREALTTCHPGSIHEGDCSPLTRR